MQKDHGCSQEQVAEILGAQEVVPPPDYIDFLEKFGGARQGRRRGHWLYYPENLEVPARLLGFGLAAPFGFYFAYRESDGPGSYKFSVTEHDFYYFRERDPAVYRLKWQGDQWRDGKYAETFTEWLENEEDE